MSFAHVSWIEVFGFVTGAVNVWLLARQNIWNWPIGIANNLAYLTLFATSGLYGDAGLQAVYIALAVYGWRLWIRGGGGSSLPVTRTSATTWKYLVPAALVAAVFLRWFLARFTDSTVPGWDGATTALSLAATYGQCRKLLESWWLWILVDLIYIPLYLYKGLSLTALLYFVFLLLCIFGLREWLREMSGAMQPKPGEHAPNLLG
jgi:nicotinamide mononucleotide transporter